MWYLWGRKTVDTWVLMGRQSRRCGRTQEPGKVREKKALSPCWKSISVGQRPLLSGYHPLRWTDSQSFGPSMHPSNLSYCLLCQNLYSMYYIGRLSCAIWAHWEWSSRSRLDPPTSDQFIYVKVLPKIPVLEHASPTLWWGKENRKNNKILMSLNTTGGQINPEYLPRAKGSTESTTAYIYLYIIICIIYIIICIIYIYNLQWKQLIGSLAQGNTFWVGPSLSISVSRSLALLPNLPNAVTL